MSTKVFFVYPPTRLIHREDRCQVPSGHIIIAPVYPPTDLMYMAAVAEKEGCICRITDYTIGGVGAADFINDLRSFRPDYLVLSITTPTLNLDLDFCSVVKGILPEVRIIAKGAHFLKFSYKVLENYPELDMVIRGETEATLQEILSGKELKDIQGLTWRGPSGIVCNPDRPFIEDLDSLPFPARHLIDNSRYVKPDNNKIMGIIRVSRGCQFHCFFCLATPVSGAKVRMRSPENILKEIRMCIDEYNMRDFIFYSDVFNMDRYWVMELCKAIIGSGLKFEWSANARVSNVDLEMAEYMRKAGCSLVSIGVESGNQEILNKMGKGIRLDQGREAVRIFKKAGIATLAYYLIGLPWETRKTVEDTICFAIELDSDFASFFAAVPFPGTRFFEYASENGFFDAGTGDYAELYKDAYYSPTVGGHYLSKDEIAKLPKEAVRRFYLRPRYILRSILGIRSWRELINYSRAALSVIGK